MSVHSAQGSRTSGYSLHPAHHSGRQLSIVSRPFAGRIGGNQEFTINPDGPSYEKITAAAPDAAPLLTWKASVALDGFRDGDLYRQATIEGVGTCLLVYLSGMLALALVPFTTATSLGPIVPAAIGSIINLILIPLFIFAGGPVSGGHFNPFITISTFRARLSSLPRTVLYVIFQCTGAVVAGFLVRASLGRPKKMLEVVPGCYIDPHMTTPGEAYALETMTALALIFISFGVGLDPRQRGVFGPALAPILVGFGSASCTFLTGFVKENYTGPSLNPGRCFGLMAASGRFDYHYIHWLGDITAAVLNGILYALIPLIKPGVKTEHSNWFIHPTVNSLSLVYVLERCEPNHIEAFTWSCETHKKSWAQKTLAQQ